jgi:hypothetical protein
MVNMRTPILLWSFVVLLAALAVLCLFYPRIVQSYALRAVQTGITARSSGLRSFVSSNQYLYVVRTVGAIGLVMALFVVVGALRRS